MKNLLQKNIQHIKTMLYIWLSKSVEKRLRLYEFAPNENGYDTYFVMGTSEEEARKRILETENERPNSYPFSKYIKKYVYVNSYGINEVAYSDNC
jgi:hypothetical protein